MKPDLKLKICGKDHPEIAHAGNRCPVCRMVSTYKRLVSAAENEIQSLHQYIGALKGE
jgi:hypothetical protein